MKKSAIKNQKPDIENHPETVLFAVTGMSPAVLTETIWALAQEKPAVIPDRVVAVTTIGGRQAIERELLTAPSDHADLPPTEESKIKNRKSKIDGRDAGPTVWQELRLAILGREAARQERLILEPPRLVQAPNPRTGQADWLEDLRTPADNNAAANFLLSELRRYTETPDTRLIVSIAGGRKTMGALLCACVSLLGRETDRLTHVLVNEPFDDPRLKPRFYFPRQLLQELAETDGTRHRAADARIDLADIPFVAFRNLFERDLVRKPSSFVELVRRCRGKVEEMARENVRLEMKRSRRTARVNGIEVKLSSLQCLVLLFLAENARLGKPAPEKYEAALEPLQEFAAQVKAECVAEDGNDWRDEAVAPEDGQRLRKVLGEITGKLRQAGSEAALLVRLLPKRGRFTLDLPPSAITLED